MKLNWGFKIKPIENRYIIFNNNKINRLQIYGTLKITKFYTKKFSVCPNTTPKFLTTAKFKSSVKENND
jgi:hypothetical protein